MVNFVTSLKKSAPTLCSIIFQTTCILTEGNMALQTLKRKSFLQKIIRYKLKTKNYRVRFLLRGWINLTSLVYLTSFRPQNYLLNPENIKNILIPYVSMYTLINTYCISTCRLNSICVFSVIFPFFFAPLWCIASTSLVYL